MTVTWSDLEAAAPNLATEGRRLIYARGDGEALLATVRGDDLPRIHPVNVAVVDGRLYVFVIARSPKRGDLEADGRFALHTHQDPAAPSELALRGRIGETPCRGAIFLADICADQLQIHAKIRPHMVCGPETCTAKRLLRSEVKEVLLVGPPARFAG
jgi:hypothetical protein